MSTDRASTHPSLTFFVSRGFRLQLSVSFHAEMTVHIAFGKARLAVHMLTSIFFIDSPSRFIQETVEEYVSMYSFF